MITAAIPYMALITALAFTLFIISKKIEIKLFEVLPPIVLLYLGCMLLSSAGLWLKTPEINGAYKMTKGIILPSMIFLMLLKCDLRKIWNLGPKMILAFFAASFSIGIGFIVTYLLFKSSYASLIFSKTYTPDTWKAFAALSGSWMGGTGNMVAVQGALKIPDANLGYALLMDSINYAVWVAALLSAVPFAKQFNKWTRANTSALKEATEKLADENVEDDKLTKTSLPILIIAAALAWFISTGGATYLPVSAFFSTTTWTVLIATTLGVAVALKAPPHIEGSGDLAGFLLYILVALIASRANFAELASAPIYICSGFFILGIHGLVMVVLAKIFHLDLFTCGVASLANIGGVASAPILAASYNRSLIPVGILMAMLGYVVGTGGGLLIGKILSML